MEDIEKNKTITNQCNDVFTGRVLLVENNVDNKKLISLYIRVSGAEVDVSVNAEQAIEMALRNNYDLILMDINTPVIGGVELIRILKSKKIKIPVVVLTTDPSLDVSEKKPGNESNNYLIKPIDRKQLYDIFHQYLKLSSGEIIPLKSCLLANEPELYDLIKKYINKYPDMIEKLKMTFKESEFSSFDMLLHDIKSTGGNYGFMLITDLAIMIKTHLNNNDVKAIGPLLDELELLHQRMLLAL